MPMRDRMISFWGNYIAPPLGIGRDVFVRAGNYVREFMGTNVYPEKPEASSTYVIGSLITVGSYVLAISAIAYLGGVIANSALGTTTGNFISPYMAPVSAYLSSMTTVANFFRASVAGLQTLGLATLAAASIVGIGVLAKAARDEYVEKVLSKNPDLNAPLKTPTINVTPKFKDSAQDVLEFCVKANGNLQHIQTNFANFNYTTRATFAKIIAQMDAINSNPNIEYNEKYSGLVAYNLQLLYLIDRIEKYPYNYLLKGATLIPRSEQQPQNTQSQTPGSAVVGDVNRPNDPLHGAPQVTAYAKTRKAQLDQMDQTREEPKSPKPPTKPTGNKKAGL